VAAILAPFGFRDVRRADAHLQEMAKDPLDRALLAELVGEILECVSRSADPDQSLALLERVSAASLGRRELYDHLVRSPATLEVLTRAFGASPFVAEVLVRHPGYLYWVCEPNVLRSVRSRDAVRSELASALGPFGTEEKRLDALRVFKRRELLHIAVRDILRLARVEETLAALSELAEVLIEAAYQVSLEEALRATGAALPAGPHASGYAVVALGKLGGGELNFSSDVDLLYVYSSDRGRAPGTAIARPAFYDRLSRRLTAALGANTSEGHVFRVDLRLRPEGRMGSLAYSVPAMRRYYASRGSTWERLALLKAWPVAGDPSVGARFLRTVRPFVFGAPFGPEAFGAVLRLRGQIAAQVEGRGEGRTNVKLGTGGIREIEFVTQALQARHGRKAPALRQRGTLAALAALRAAGLLPSAEHDVLSRAYLFLRDVENKLQMVADAQVHALPQDPVLLRGLARTLGYRHAAGHDALRQFESDYAGHTAAVNEVFTRVFGGAGAQPG